jgi:DNA gyrase/topoisomerase IV subunit A
VNLLRWTRTKRINAILPVREFDEDRYVFFATQEGVVKKTSLADYSRPRPSGSSRSTWTRATAWWAWRSPTASTT